MGCSVMKPLISKWKMLTPYAVSMGDGTMPSRSIPADTVFAALLSVAPETSEILIQGAREGRLRLSDALPYQGEQLFLPSIPGAVEGQRQSGAMADLPGRVVAAGHRYGYLLPESAGLYVMLQITDDLKPILENAVEALALSGIGAERSLGCGRFFASPLQPLALLFGEDAQALSRALDVSQGALLSLAAAWPENEEDLRLCRGSLYVKSCGVLPSYALAAGFTATQAFEGQMLCGQKGDMPYVRYLYPLFREVPHG